MNGSIMGWFSLPESLEYTENFLSGSYRDRMAEHMLSEEKTWLIFTFTVAMYKYRVVFLLDYFGYL